MTYSVGGINMEITIDPQFDLGLLEQFKSDCKGEPHSQICINGCDKILNNENHILLDDCYKWYRGLHERTIVYIPDQTGDSIACMVTFNKQCSEVQIEYVRNLAGIEQVLIKHFLYIVFRILILFYKGIFIHASSFLWKGMGIFVTAPSGTGKSTHTALWEKYYSAVVINDDCSAIRILNSRPALVGNPWSGSSNKFINITTPLTAAVILEQAAENSIRRLNQQEAVFRTLPRFILPYFDKELLNVATDCINFIFKDLPVFLLKCRPDREAAMTVASCLSQIQ